MDKKHKVPTVILNCSHCQKPFECRESVAKMSKKVYRFCCGDHRLAFHRIVQKKRRDARTLARQALFAKPTTVTAWDTLLLVVAGKKYQAGVIREALGISKETVEFRLKRGWPIREAYLTPQKQ